MTSRRPGRPPKPKGAKRPLRVQRPTQVPNGENCPNPHKRGWATRKDAKWSVRSTKTKTGRSDIHAYLCECGVWHVGHKIGTRYKKLKKEGLLDD